MPSHPPPPPGPSRSPGSPHAPPEARELRHFEERCRTSGPSSEDTLDGVWFRELLAYDHGDAPGLFADLVERFRQDCLALRPRLAALAADRAADRGADRARLDEVHADPVCVTDCRRLAQAARPLGLGRLATLLGSAGSLDPAEATVLSPVTAELLMGELDRGLEELLELADEDGEASNPRHY